MELTLYPQETALLVIDMQNTFCHVDGTLHQDGVDITPMKVIIPRVKALVELAKGRGIPDLWSIQEHFPADKMRDAHRITPHTLKRIRPVALKGTWDAEIVDELRPLIDERSHVFSKNRFSCFYNTNLEVLLRVLGIRMLLVAGVATNVCVETTVRDAYMRDYDVIVLKDCVASATEHLHRATLENIDRYLGMTKTLEEITQMLPMIAR
ncbi:MAG: cysteine hydrolase [Chloroflexi bacterium]|nr:cysteine hydrolase [Chloroflexota bacterium]